MLTIIQNERKGLINTEHFEIHSYAVLIEILYCGLPRSAAIWSIVLSPQGHILVPDIATLKSEV